MINSQNLINKICTCISGGGLTALQSCQLNGALNVLCAPVCSVATFSNLPTATDNVGRMIYVHAENRYYYSFDGFWLNEFQSTIYNYKDTVWSWGCNSTGQLGTNSTTDRSCPVSVVGGDGNWCQSSAGCHSVAIGSSGTAWAWGCNNVGLLGDGTTGTRSSPVSVVGGFSDWCQVSAGPFHTVAVRTSGSAWAWGCNGLGRLGDNTVTDRSSPVSVVGGFVDWCQVSAGDSFTLAVRTGGTAWAWGYNGGRLGDNTVTNRSSPVSVVGGFSDWCQASAGGAHSVAVRSSGSAWAWGVNNTGRLGDGTSIARSSPVSVVGGFSDWCQASAGGFTGGHSLAVRTNGSAWGWGTNTNGRVGDNTITSRSSPVSVVGGFTNWCQISAGNGHSVAMRTSGSAWAWGTNNVGQIGDNTSTARSSPVSVAGGFTDWSNVSAGGSHTLGIRQEVKGF